MMQPSVPGTTGNVGIKSREGWRGPKKEKETRDNPTKYLSRPVPTKGMMMIGVPARKRHRVAASRR